jgi:hypothetical protein
MIEFAIIVALIVVSRRLRRPTAIPQRIEIHVHHHWPSGGPGESDLKPKRNRLRQAATSYRCVVSAADALHQSEHRETGERQLTMLTGLTMIVVDACFNAASSYRRRCNGRTLMNKRVLVSAFAIGTLASGPRALGSCVPNLKRRHFSRMRDGQPRGGETMSDRRTFLLSAGAIAMTLASTLLLTTSVTLSVVLVTPVLAQDAPSLGFVNKLGIDVDVRSGGRILQDEAPEGTIILPDNPTAAGGGSPIPQIQLRGGNLQVNDPELDYIQTFSGFRPFLHFTQSEVSVAASNRNIVATYNNSAGLHVSPTGSGLVVDKVQLSGFSVSNDGGQTWSSGFMPPAAGASQTFGDPSVGVDRHGVFYFATLGADALNHPTIQVNKSIDGGNTWSDAVIVQQDDGSDKEWLAVGPDPVQKNRDNVYVTWTSFQSTGSELRFGRSTDGGVTWTANTIFVPTADPDPTHPQNALQFSNPVVDQIRGALYVPFLHFSNADQDFIQMLISDDAGETFRFATFNIPGAPDSTVMPVTQPGELTQCGPGNFRLTIHDAANAGPGRFGLPRYINASRMTLQPALAARNGTLYLAWSNSTSLSYGAGTGSNILFVRSTDGGNTWSVPIQVNPDGDGDKQHVLPALAIDNDPNDVHITYYTQHGNDTIDLDMANSHDGGNSFPSDRTVDVTSTSMKLPPTNISLSTAPPFVATNYDRQIAVCYALGEYQSVVTANGTVYAGWGDTRNLVTEPVSALNPISGQTHPQEDVFFQQVKAQ